MNIPSVFTSAAMIFSCVVLPEPTEWKAMLTPEAQERFDRIYCSDVLAAVEHTSTEVRLQNETWQYLDGEMWRDIPSYVIHRRPDPNMPAQLKLEGVLFFFEDQPVCFWPPQNGG